METTTRSISARSLWEIGRQMWIVTDGVKPGEHVVVEGLMKVRDGAPVKVRFYRSLKGRRLAMSKFFINRPIVAMVISILMVIVGAVTIASLPVAQFPAHRAAGSADPGHLRRRRRADHRAVRRHADRAADERRGQHELHVFAERHGQRARCG